MEILWIIYIFDKVKVEQFYLIKKLAKVNIWSTTKHITVLQSTINLSSDREQEGNANFGWGCVGGSSRYPPLTLTVACCMDNGIANDC